MNSRRVVFAPEAEAHLASLYAYIAGAASPHIALQYTNAIVDFCETLSASPFRGTPRADLRPGLRVMSYRRRATIAFAVEEDTVVIAGIFYGGRDYEAILRNEV